MTTEIKPLFTELAAEEAMQIQGGQSFFFGLPIPSFGTIAATVNAPPGQAPTSSFQLTLAPEIGAVLSFLGLPSTFSLFSR
jgi:hypothetical protein